MRFKQNYGVQEQALCRLGRRVAYNCLCRQEQALFGLVKVISLQTITRVLLLTHYMVLDEAITFISYLFIGFFRVFSCGGGIANET